MLNVNSHALQEMNELKNQLRLHSLIWQGMCGYTTVRVCVQRYHLQTSHCMHVSKRFAFEKGS